MDFNFKEAEKKTKKELEKFLKKVNGFYDELKGKFISNKYSYIGKIEDIIVFPSPIDDGLIEIELKTIDKNEKRRVSYYKIEDFENSFKFFDSENDALDEVEENI